MALFLYNNFLDKKNNKKKTAYKCINILLVSASKALFAGLVGKPCVAVVVSLPSCKNIKKKKKYIVQQCFSKYMLKQRICNVQRLFLTNI